jgi:hypothetical protein
LDQRPKAWRKERAREIRKMVTVMMQQQPQFEMMLIGVWFI